MKKLLALLLTVSSVALYAGCGCSTCGCGSNQPCTCKPCCKETEAKDQQQQGSAENDKCPCNQPKPTITQPTEVRQ